MAGQLQCLGARGPDQVAQRPFAGKDLELLCQVLELLEVGESDRFFDLGGGGGSFAALELEDL